MSLLPFLALSKFTDFENKQILEIGGNSNCQTAIPFLGGGAKKVVISGLNHVEDGQDPILPIGCPGEAALVKADARRLCKVFEPDFFDIVYGIAVLEHITDIPTMLDQVFCVLKPGGYVYLEGNPIWSGPLGHHLWVNPWQNQSKGSYLFTDHPEFIGSSNPIPDWAHLYMSPTELGDYMLAQELPPHDVIRILDWVYNDPDLNRLSIHEICSAFSGSRFIVMQCTLNDELSTLGPHAKRGNGTLGDDERIEKWKKENSEWPAFNITGVSYILYKPESRPKPAPG